MNDLVSTISVDPIIFLEGETTKCISLSDERKLFGPAGTQNWEFHNTSRANTGTAKLNQIMWRVLKCKLIL